MIWFALFFYCFTCCSKNKIICKAISMPLVFSIISNPGLAFTSSTNKPSFERIKSTPATTSPKALVARIAMAFSSSLSLTFLHVPPRENSHETRRLVQYAALWRRLYHRSQNSEYLSLLPLLQILQ